VSRINEVTYRWIDGPSATDTEWAYINNELAKRGWMALHPDLSRVLVAEIGGAIVGFSALQMTPYCGPLFVEKFMRGSGVAERLADDTIQFLVDINARGWIIVANSPHIPPLCEKYGMQKLQQPVYTTERIRES